MTGELVAASLIALLLLLEGATSFPVKYGGNDIVGQLLPSLTTPQPPIEEGSYSFV